MFRIVFIMLYFIFRIFFLYLFRRVLFVIYHVIFIFILFIVVFYYVYFILFGPKFQTQIQVVPMSKPNEGPILAF